MTIKRRWNAEALKLFRQHADLTQEDLAKRLGISVYTVVHWERGHAPSGASVDLLCSFFSVTTSDFFN